MESPKLCTKTAKPRTRTQLALLNSHDGSHATTSMLLRGTITVLATTALAVAQDSTPCLSYDVNTGSGA
jgi:hypothetical protein